MFILWWLWFQTKSMAHTTDTHSKHGHVRPKYVVFSSFTVLAVEFFAIYLFSISVLGWFSLSKFCVDQKLIRTKGCPNSSRLILITYCFRFFICHEPSSSFQWSFKAVSLFFLLLFHTSVDVNGINFPLTHTRSHELAHWPYILAQA